MKGNHFFLLQMFCDLCVMWMVWKTFLFNLFLDTVNAWRLPIYSSLKDNWHRSWFTSLLLKNPIPDLHFSLEDQPVIREQRDLFLVCYLGGPSPPLLSGSKFLLFYAVFGKNWSNGRLESPFSFWGNLALILRWTVPDYSCYGQTNLYSY